MLNIIIPEKELYDEENNKFINIKETKLSLEHSLVSISKWEAKHHKPFLSDKEKTVEESIDYVRCMTLTQNVNPNVYYGLNFALMNAISEYIQDPMTATWFSNKLRSSNKRVITSELIYFWMSYYGIPMECQKWHFNRLITLIRVCGEENNSKGNKMSKKELAMRNTELNAKRRRMLNTRG